MLAVIAFTFDFRDRLEQRAVDAWQLLTAPATGNSGKKEALEYLNRRHGLCLLDRCLYVLRDRSEFVGIDLSPHDDDPDEGPGAIGVWLREVDIPGANLGFADLRGANLNGANLRGAYLWGTYLTFADLRGANLNAANLTDAYLKHAVLIGATLVGAELKGAYLWNAHLSSADLRDADLGGATLQSATFGGADLRGASLSYANLRSANLGEANLSGADLTGACGDEYTRLPDGYTIPMCSE